MSTHRTAGSTELWKDLGECLGVEALKRGGNSARKFFDNAKEVIFSDGGSTIEIGLRKSFRALTGKPFMLEQLTGPGRGGTRVPIATVHFTQLTLTLLGRRMAVCALKASPSTSSQLECVVLTKT